jgi:hypothetical protein
LTADVIDATADVAVIRNTARGLPADAQTYSRIFTGTGACGRLETIGGHPLWQVRIGTPAGGIRTFSANVVIGGDNGVPRPVEEALSSLPRITGVALVGVPDRGFGPAAFVVERR